jgi:hypothetical protein
LGRIDEWHVDISKPLRENDMCKKGVTCVDGFDYEPIFGKRPNGASVIPRNRTTSESFQITATNND